MPKRGVAHRFRDNRAGKVESDGRSASVVDLVLFDIKHLDSEKHQAMTGVKNQLILDNLGKAAKQNQVWIRVPLIAGFNDSESTSKELPGSAERLRRKKFPYCLSRRREVEMRTTRSRLWFSGWKGP